MHLRKSNSTNVALDSTSIDFVRQKMLRINRVNLVLLSVGALITLYAYSNPLPLFAAAIFYCTVYVVLCLPKVGGTYERRIFTRVFAVGFVMASISAIYANYFFDASQLYSDAAGFFHLAAGQAKGLNLFELQVLHEGSVAIVIWSAVYDIFADLGFPRERYVGVLVNVTAVAFTGVVALKMTKLVYGQSLDRYKRLSTLFGTCGLFWLFAAIHVRDSVVLLSITTLTYAWAYFLSKPGLGWPLLQIIACSLLIGLFLGFLRGEFVFVPIAMLGAGTAALLVGRKGSRSRMIPYMLVFFGFAIVLGLLSSYGDIIYAVLLRGGEGYSEHAAEQHSADSLGMTLIINQPMPIKLALGTVYLFVFPIPFWSGFQLESAYALFKSFNVLFFYFLLPLLALAVRQLWQHKVQRTPVILFMLFLSIGFALAIAGTSLETRHFGAFLVPIFMLAMLPDLRSPVVRHNYRQLLMVLLGGVVLVHLTWVGLKI